MTCPWINKVKFDAAGLVPVVVTATTSGRPLMLAYADRQALQRTIETGQAHFHSRSRDALWRKGETSGNTMEVTSVALDCDSDALCYEVNPSGPACHTGAASCFFDIVWGESMWGGDRGARGGPELGCEPGHSVGERQPVPSTTTQILEELSAVIEQRKREMPEGSYVARLLKGGPGAAARKVGEEAVEAILAALAEDDSRLINEVADLWFHSLVLLAARGRGLDDVCAELAARRKG